MLILLWVKYVAWKAVSQFVSRWPCVQERGSSSWLLFLISSLYFLCKALSMSSVRSSASVRDVTPVHSFWAAGYTAMLLKSQSLGCSCGELPVQCRLYWDLLQQCTLPHLQQERSQKGGHRHFYAWKALTQAVVAVYMNVKAKVRKKKH